LSRTTLPPNPMNASCNKTNHKTSEIFILPS
jgi:hypothetical protein